jgi:hypothetical protein
MGAIREGGDLKIKETVLRRVGENCLDDIGHTKEC